jgi:predicted acyltransferase
MLLVCHSHFGDTYLNPLGLDQVDDLLSGLTLMATPAFILVSGLVLGFLYYSRGEGVTFDRMRRKLLDRALFLLTVAHVAIVAAHVPMFGWKRALDIVFITDVVAICVITGTLLVPMLGARGRAALGVSLYGGATLIVLLWMPAQVVPGQLIKHVLVGHKPALEESTFVYNFPVLQWLGLYLLATVLGQGLARAQSARAQIAMLAGLGVALAGSAVLLRAVRPGLGHLLELLTPSRRDTLEFLTARWQKLPPGPVYLLFYSGLALCLVAGCLWLCRVSPSGAVTMTLELVGRNSLITFVLQYLVYYCLIFSLHLPYTRLWPLLFAATYLLLVMAAWVWQRTEAGRFLTVGYPGFVAWAEGFGRRRMDREASRRTPTCRT